MSKILAYVNRHTGEVTSTAVMSVAAEGPADGELVGDTIARDISGEADWLGFGENNFWENGGWSTRPSKPSGFHAWRNGQWEFDRASFEGFVRRGRDTALAESDWTQLADANLSDDESNSWRGYRQELRDLMGTLSDTESMDDVNWPEPPLQIICQFSEFRNV